MGKRVNLVGQRFGMLIVAGVARDVAHDVMSWLCLCDCGGRVNETSHRLMSGRRRSCGCMKRAPKKHGQARRAGARTATYQTWASMMGRCYRPTAGGYRFYGARGIQICERWHTFENFATDMGDRPNDATLDRYPNKNGNYEPGNCRWASRLEQSRNTRRNVVIEHEGQSRCASEWAALIGVSVTTIYARLRDGWPTERVLSPPMRHSPFKKAATCA